MPCHPSTSFPSKMRLFKRKEPTLPLTTSFKSKPFQNNNKGEASYRASSKDSREALCKVHKRELPSKFTPSGRTAPRARKASPLRSSVHTPTSPAPGTSFTEVRATPAKVLASDGTQPASERPLKTGECCSWFRAIV